MFGYIVPEKPELKVKEYESYRAVYCGVCKSIGRRYGILPRFTLNYDSVFLALMIMNVLDIENKKELKRCMVHPVNKRQISMGNTAIDYAADMSLLLFYYKLKDDWHDDKKLLALSGISVFHRMAKQLKRKHPNKAIVIEHQLSELLLVEKNKISQIDIAAEPFAKLMEETMMFEELCNDKKILKALGWLGYNIGKWIYIIDAYDDIKKDKETNAYNPFVCQYEMEIDAKADGITISNHLKERVDFMLMCCLSEVAKAFELLEIKVEKGTIENIIYFGLLRKTEQILEQGRCKKIE